MAGPDRPRLAVLAGPEASLSPAEVARSADGVADVVFLLDSRDDSAAARDLRAVAGALLPTAVVDFGDLAASAAAVRGTGAAAVTTFTDGLCGVAARLTAELSGTAAVPPRWGRKDVQRRTLLAAGLSRVRSALVRDEASLRAFVRSVGLPVVVKPTDGAASRDTWLLRAEPDVADLARRGLPPGTSMLAEEFIVGEPAPQPHLADYVSVEVFRPGGAARAFVTDRLVPAWPCRETGLVLPSVLTADQQQPVVAGAERALDCLGATSGVFHVELKPARPAPEIVEVNGRLGGFVSRLVRYGTGADLGRQALRCALGRPVDLDLSWDRCVLVLLFQPPARARRVVRAPARRETARRPGVAAVDQVSPAGTGVDWRDGTNRAVAWVWLAADGHLELRERLVDLAAFLDDSFGFVDDSGRAVADRSWLDLIAERSSA
jgi:biotin carboxylase